jgi:hypothetical protein
VAKSKSRILLAFLLGLTASLTALGQTTGKPHNIVVIMGDDIGIWNIGAYHRGMMSGKTPNLDRIAAEGMLFTDYYAEASCTAGRANFITGELPIRTGMSTVGQAGSLIGLPAQRRTSRSRRVLTTAQSRSLKNLARGPLSSNCDDFRQDTEKTRRIFPRPNGWVRLPHASAKTPPSNS